MRRTLRLQREALAELSTDELTEVVGAATGVVCVAGQVLDKVTQKFCNSYNCTR